jgi:hypothetical protein
VGVALRADRVVNMLKLMKGEQDSERIGRLLRSAFRDSQEPPPYFEDSLEEMAPFLEGVPKKAVHEIVASAQAKLFPPPSLGSLVSNRRQELDADTREVTSAAGWADEDLAELEEDRLDLQRIAPEHLATLFRVLRLRFVDVTDSIRVVAERHLVVRALPAGPLLGRTRRGVTSFERRADLGRGLGPIDEDATRRAIEVYLQELKEALSETE